MFVRGNPIHFSRAKAKELLAYLIDRRGANCTPAEIAAVLWEDGIYDRSRQKQYSNIRRTLYRDLKAAGAENILKKGLNIFSVDAEQFDCDYYMALSGNVSAINSFMGEYMSLYSWAELTSAVLNNKVLSQKQ